MAGRTNSPTSARMIDAAAKRDALADHIANGGGFVDFAQAHRMTDQGVYRIWGVIRRSLGAQAV